MDNDILDKTIVYINSSNCLFKNGTNFDITFDLQEPIRNALYITIIKTDIILNPSQSINNLAIEDGDSIYVNLKNYSRIRTNIDGINVKCFDQIIIDLSDKFGVDPPPNANILFRSEYASTVGEINDINTHVLNPMEPNLKRFDIQLYDKKYQPIQKNNIKRFATTLCVYHSRKKITQF